MSERKTIIDFAKQFNKDIQRPPAVNLEAMLSEIKEWIYSHKEALLLAWFAQYGFEPGKAVLVTDGLNTYIREATPKELEQAKELRTRYMQEQA